jgi:hypothetical protein
VELVSPDMTVTQRLCAATACACLALPTFSLSPMLAGAGAQGTIAAKTKLKCKKGFVLKHGRCTRKTPATTVSLPYDGSYSGDDGMTVTVASSNSGNRSVSVSVLVPLTCPSGSDPLVLVSVRNMAATGKTFAGTSAADPQLGQTTMSGTFLNAQNLHLIAKVADYKDDGTETCVGQRDVTTEIQFG